MDPFGALAMQRHGDIGVHDGHQWQPSSQGVEVTYPAGTSFGSGKFNFSDGTTGVPVTGASARPTIYINRTVLTGATIDGGAIMAKVNSQIGGSIQANVFTGFMDQHASADATIFGGQLNMENPGGAGIEFYSQLNNNAHAVTITHASPAVVTLAAHGFLAGHELLFQAVGGALPSGMPASPTRAFVLAAGLTANTFEVALAPAGAAINTTDAGSGTFYVTGNAMWGYTTLIENISNVDLIYTGGSVAAMSGYFVQVAGNALAGSAFRVETDGGQFSEGIIFGAGTVKNQTVYDASAAVTFAFITGAKTSIIDYSNTTTTYLLTIGAGDATDPTGGGGAATGRIPINVGGVTRYIPWY